MRLVWWLAASLVACAGPGGAGGGDSTARPPERGDAANTICRAECHRNQRCGDPGSAECLARCATLPVRDPAVWSGAWATEVASCIEAADCGHDREERCVFATTRRTEAAAACLRAAVGGKQQARCVVLQGLTPFGEQQVRACQAAGGDPCAPPYDWK